MLTFSVVLRRVLGASVIAGGILAAGPAAAQEVDTERPSVPSARVVVSQEGGAVDLSWGEATDNVAVVEYAIYIDGALRNTSSVNSATLQDLEAGRTYKVFVRAADAAGNVGFRSGTTTFTVNTDVDTERPTVPGRPQLDDDGFIRWTPSTDNVGVTKYILFAPAEDPRVAPPVRLFETDGPEAEIQLPGGTYTFFIRAADAAGNIGFRTGVYTITTPDLGPDTTRPSVPSSGIRLDPNGRTLRWGGSTDDRGVAGYELIDADTTTVIGTTPGNSFTFDRGMAEPIRVFVRAFDAAGNRSFRTGIFDGQIGDPDRPSIPGAIQWTRPEAGVVSMTWAASTDNIAVAGYRVYTADRTLVAETPTNSITFDFADAGSFYVRAFDAAGNESYRTGLRAIPAG